MGNYLFLVEQLQRIFTYKIVTIMFCVGLIAFFITQNQISAEDQKSKKIASRGGLFYIFFSIVIYGLVLFLNSKF